MIECAAFEVTHMPEATVSVIFIDIVGRWLIVDVPELYSEIGQVVSRLDLRRAGCLLEMCINAY
jgi:hypothetical protein